MISLHSSQSEYKVIQINNLIFARVRILFLISKVLQIPINNKIFIEVPVKLYYSYPERVPPSYKYIDFRTRSLGYIRSGNIRWWVLITAWLYELLLSVLLLAAFLPAFGYNFWVITITSTPLSIPYISLCKGTAKKLSRHDSLF